MRFLTLSEQEIKTSRIYSAIKEKHIVISITSAADEEIVLPHNISRVSQMFLKFDDVQDIDSRFIYFDRSMAHNILQFVEKYINQISLIVVQCQAGISRSVAIASALSKIINFSDDAIFTSGIPNMFVYTTLLDQLFGNRYWQNEYPKIKYQRMQGMARYLNPGKLRLANAIEKRRLENE